MECEGEEGGEEMDEEKRGEEEGKCEVMARPETISSTVVIKKADALMSPFLQLKQNADLNLPPPDWLRTNSPAGPAVFVSQTQFTTKRNKRDPSSVLLASHNPEYMGQVDVISDAKDIKKLLKMPYCPSRVSMAVHRVGKTLLIDEFNAPLFFRETAALNLEKLFNQGELSELILRKKDPAVSRHRNMFSKLLYYSVQNNQGRGMLPAPNPPSDPQSAATVGLGEEEEEEGDSFVLGAFSPAEQETTRVLGPAGQETTRPLSPAGQETMRALSPAGQETMRALSPAGQETTRTLGPAGQETMRRLGPAGQETMRAFGPAGQETTRTLGPAGQETMRALSPAGQETTRTLGPAGQETMRAFSPAGQEPFSVEEYDIDARSVELESSGGDSAVTDRREGGDGTSAETERKNERGRVPVSFERKESASLKELTAKGADTLTEDKLPGPKDQPKPVLALVPLTETTHGFVVGTTCQARPPGSTQSSGRLQTEVMSNADGPSCPPGENLSEGERGAGGEVTIVEGNTRPVVLAGPEEEEEEQSVDPHATFPCPPPEPPSQPFHLNMQWNIEDIRMLLGSDLPIFGSGGHPAISLRLRDMQKPITVLTGLDYWLDNLMCNVPELAMCFHLNGIVQRYEIIKTEEIPNLLDKNCQFSAQEVLEVAQNILAFLKANCTQEGHTYWLFRRKGEDVVKLYDLTSLDKHKEEDSSGQGNPFAQSVAMLFYRVAQNLLGSSDESLSSEERTTVRLLLENCIRLLGDEKSQIVISAYYLLAQLFLSRTPPSSHDDKEEEKEEDNEEEGDEREEVEDKKEEVEDQEEEEGTGKKEKGEEEVAPKNIPANTATDKVLAAANLKSLSVSALRQGPQSFPVNPSLPPHPLLPPHLLFGNSQDRARTALECISKALSMLNMSQLCSLEGIPPWQAASGRHLLQQAGSAYFLLSDVTMGLGKLGRALRYGRYSVLCVRASEVLGSSSSLGEASVLFRAWQLCGDIHCLSTKLSESFSSNLEDFHLENPEDAPLITIATTLYHPEPGGKDDLCLTLHTELETSLLRSVDCYMFAQAMLPSPAPPPSPSPPPIITGHQQRLLCDKLGNAWNELGVYYMHVAASLDFANEPKQVEKLWTSSYSCLMEGLERFQSSTNVPNQALLYANLGSLMQSCAQAHGVALGEEGKRGEFTPQEKLYYGKAAEFYIQGKQVLRRRSAHPAIWGNLVADLSAVYFTTGKLLQERAPLSTLTPLEVEREIIEVLMKALRHTEPELAHVDPTSQSFVSLSQRAGDCHYRLASLYQRSAFTATSSAQRQKHCRTQAEKHYSKALNFYIPEHHFKLVLRVLLEKALLYEQQVQGRAHLRWLQSALKCLLECYEPLQEYPDEHSDGASPDPLFSVLVHRLQAVLKQLVAVYMKKNDASLACYKSMYALALRLPASRDEPYEKLLHVIRETLKSIIALQPQT